MLRLPSPIGLDKEVIYATILNHMRPLERLIEGYRVAGLQSQADALARDLADFRKSPDFPEDLPAASFSTPRARRESLPTPEQLVLRTRFSDLERRRLLDDQARIYLLSGTTIPQQREAQAAKGKPSFWYVIDGGENLLALPSRQIEVAIFPAPERFFAPGSFGKNTARQEQVVREDAQNELHARLDLPGVTQIIPDEAATFADLTFQHLDATGRWLFGPEYAEAQGLSWVYGRTKNRTNRTGSSVALVGHAYPDRGLDVNGWDRGHGDDLVGGVRLVVAFENR